MNRRPAVVNIAGIPYPIQYTDKPSDVDVHGRDSCWGQIDYWTRTIRVYGKDVPDETVLLTIMHEVLHGIAELLHVKMLEDKENHDQLDVLAAALADVLVRNKWVELQ